MIHKINETLYRIRTYTGVIHFVECDSVKELYRYVIDLQLKGYVITSINRMDSDGSTPKIAVFTNKEYKKLLTEMRKG